MTREAYRTIADGGSSEVTEKKSRFIGDCRHVESEAEALAFLNEIRKKYYDAKHHCYAFVIGRDGALERSSDDGEPQGTAGHPILGVIRGEGLCDCAIVVTRYFGGTLLGTGGLVRCYGQAARDAVASSGIVEKKPGLLAKVRASYTDSGKLTYLFSENGIPVIASEYGADVLYRIVIPEGEESNLRKKLSEATAGRAVPETEYRVYYSETGGKIQLDRED